MTLYQILGVEPTASTEAIRAAFRERSKQHHPDKNGGERTQMWDQLNTARIEKARQNKIPVDVNLKILKLAHAQLDDSEYDMPPMQALHMPANTWTINF